MGLSRGGKKWLMGGFLFLLIPEHKRTVTQPRPVLALRSLHPTPAQPGIWPGGVGGWRESKQVWPCPLRQNLGSGSEISVLTAFQVMFVLDPGLWETLAQLDIGHLDSVTER